MVRQGVRSAEHRHDRVSLELVDGATVRQDDLCHGADVPGQEISDLASREMLR